MLTDPMTLLALIAGIAIVLAVIVLMARRRKQQRSAALRDHFGPEYDRLVDEHGDRTRAERELMARRKRYDQLQIKLLSPEQCERFSASWAEVQQRFVDDPRGAVHDANALVKEVMKERGYETGSFDQRVADLSVEHANVIDHYRAARTLAQASERGEASTEDLRQAMVHYRALFHDLLRAYDPHPILREARA